jgi:hypothetical protein
MVEAMSILEHPAIAGRIQLLEQEVQAKQDNVDRLTENYRALQERGAQYAERVKTVLYDLYKDGGYDEDTLLAVMRNLDIDTRATKSFEVNVTFQVEIEYALGEEIDTSNLEWDLDFEVKSSDYEVIDYSSDVLWANEA